MAIKKRKAGPAGRPIKPAAQASNRSFWLYGLHSARAALNNPRRKIRRALVTDRAQAELGQALAKTGIEPTMAAPDSISRMLPPGAVHQGVALLSEPLPALDLEDVLAGKPSPRLVAVLDQVTDPHNEGAILRSAAAFGIAALIVQDRHSPPESGVLAKAASGALDIVPRVSVVNIARALEELGRFGFWRIALAAEGDASLGEATRVGDVAIVLGAEGVGLRRLVRERCDISASIPMGGDMESLNVSNAAAVALYEKARQRKV